MKSDSREHLRDLFQLINHRLRTPLSIVVHELEHLILSGNDNCKLARDSALQISSLLANFSRLIDSQETPQELPLSLLLKPLSQQHPQIECHVSPEIIVSTRPRQMCSALAELLHMLQKGCLKEIKLNTNAAGELCICAEGNGKLSSDDGECFDSLRDLISRFQKGSQTPAALVDTVLRDNQITSKAEIKGGQLIIVLGFQSCLPENMSRQ